MKIEVEKCVGWRKNGEDHRSSVVHNGKYIFSAKEARTLGYINETREYERHILHYNDLQEAMNMMPDYDCWDSDSKILAKSVEL